MILQVDNTWPTSLPLPKVEFSGRPRNATLTSPTENAAIVRRSRFTRSYTTLSVAWCFSAVQMQTFVDFFQDDLGNGTGQFKIELRYPETSILSEWTVRFEGGYQREYDEGIFHVKAGLELIETVPSSAVTPGLVASWEASSITGVADNAQFSVWPDISGYSRSAVQIESARRPLFKEGIFGTEPAVMFDGVDDFMDFTASSIPSWTMFIVWQILTYKEFSCPLSWRGNGAGFIFMDGVGNPSAWSADLIVTNASDAEIVSKYSHGLYSTPFPSEKAIHMHRWNNLTSAHAWAMNGTAPAIYTLNGFTGFPSVARIGRGQDYIHCYIADIKVYDYALTDDEVEVVTNQLNSRYSIY